MKPEVLILDEPTAVLTPQEIEFLLEIIKGLKAAGKTIILITHKLEEIKKDEKWGYIDTHGDLVISCNWDQVYGFSEGLAAVKKGNTWYFIDKAGNIVIQ